MTSVQMIEKHVRIARELGREIATGDDARRIHEDRGHVQLRRGDALQPAKRVSGGTKPTENSPSHERLVRTDTLSLVISAGAFHRGSIHGLPGVQSLNMGPDSAQPRVQWVEE